MLDYTRFSEKVSLIYLELRHVLGYYFRWRHSALYYILAAIVCTPVLVTNPPNTDLWHLLLPF